MTSPFSQFSFYYVIIRLDTMSVFSTLSATRDKTSVGSLRMIYCRFQCKPLRSTSIVSMLCLCSSSYDKTTWGRRLLSDRNRLSGLDSTSVSLLWSRVILSRHHALPAEQALKEENMRSKGVAAAQNMAWNKCTIDTGIHVPPQNSCSTCGS